MAPSLTLSTRESSLTMAGLCVQSTCFLQLPSPRLTVSRYFWLYLIVLKSFAVYIVDIYTATTMLTTTSWSNEIFNNCADIDGCVTIPFETGKWLFVGCIIFSFLLVRPGPCSGPNQSFTLYSLVMRLTSPGKSSPVEIFLMPLPTSRPTTTTPSVRILLLPLFSPLSDSQGLIRTFASLITSAIPQS